MGSAGFGWANGAFISQPVTLSKRVKFRFVCKWISQNESEEMENKIKNEVEVYSCSRAHVIFNCADERNAPDSMYVYYLANDEFTSILKTSPNSFRNWKMTSHILWQWRKEAISFGGKWNTSDLNGWYFLWSSPFYFMKDLPFIFNFPWKIRRKDARSRRKSSNCYVNISISVEQFEMIA